MQYKKLEKLMPIARKPANVSSYKLIYTQQRMVANGWNYRKNTEGGTQFI